MSPELALIERRRVEIGATRSELERAAGLPDSYYAKLVGGDHQPRPGLLARLKLTLMRLKRRAAAGGDEDFQLSVIYRMAIVIAAGELGTDPTKAQNADPARRATHSVEWMRAAEVRRLACYLLNVGCGLKQTDVARAAGLTKQAVSLAVREIFERADADAKEGARLDRLAQQIMGDW